MIVAMVSSAQAQMTPPATAGAKPKVVTTVPIRAAPQKPEETANAMAQAERLALQSDLAWVGQYNGAITGDVSERMVAGSRNSRSPAAASRPACSIRRSAACSPTPQGENRKVPAGRSSPIPAPAYGSASRPLVPQQASDASGAKWTSPTGTIQIQLTRRKEANPTTAKLAEREKKEPAGRNIDYTVVKPDFFVLSGLQGLKKFYLRGTFRGDEVRILTILYDQAMENTVEPVVIAMSSAFNAFPAGAPIAGPPPRKAVEYGTGVVVSEDGAIVTDRLVTDECLAVTIGGYGNADRVAEDKDHDLALLRVYGTRGLKPLGIADRSAKTTLELTGIADPQNQGGGAAASGVKATAAQVDRRRNRGINGIAAGGKHFDAALDASG
jgi:hypothetical protein